MVVLPSPDRDRVCWHPTVLVWDGTDRRGVKVPAGAYVVQVRTVDGVTARKIVRLD